MIPLINLHAIANPFMQVSTEVWISLYYLINNKKCNIKQIFYSYHKNIPSYTFIYVINKNIIILISFM